MDVAELLLMLAGDSAGANKAIGEVNAGLTEMEARGNKASAAMNVLKGVVTGLAVAGAAAAAFSAVSVKMAGDFEQSMKLVRTQAHDTTDNISDLGDQVKKLATVVGIGPDELAKGLYHVTSVGYTGAAAMEILTQAAKEAQIAGANLDDTTYSLTSVMNTFGLQADKAHDTMAALNAIVGAGDMRFQDLNGAISTGFLAAGDTFGVSLQSMGAALAYLTDRGSSAEESATRLKMSINLLGAPTHQAAKILGDLGLSQDEVKQRTTAMEDALAASGVTTTKLSDDLRKPDGIMVALEDLVVHMRKGGLTADETAATLSRAFGGGRSGAAIMSMVEHLDILQSKYDAIGEGTKRFDLDWKDTTDNFNLQWGRVRAALDVVAISWGQHVLPAGTQFMKLVANGIVPAFTAMDGAVSKVTDTVGRMFGELEKGHSGAQAIFAGLFHGMGLDPKIAAEWSEKLGPTLDHIWQTVTNVGMAFDTLFFNLTHGGDVLHSLTGFFVNLGMNVDDAKRLAKDLVDAWNGAVQAAKDLWPQIQTLLGTLKDLSGFLKDTIVPAFMWVSEHGDEVKAALIAVAIGFAAIKVAELTGNILAFTGALRDAYAVAGASGTLGSLLGIKSGAADVLGISGEGGGLLGGVKAAGRGIARGAGATKTFLLGDAIEEDAAQGLGGAGALAGGADLGHKEPGIRRLVSRGAKATKSFLFGGEVIEDAAQGLGGAAAMAGGADLGLAKKENLIKRITSAIKESTLATKLWGIAEAALNLIMSANPIILVVIAIGLLVAGLIWAYFHIGWFHKFVDAAFAKLKEFGAWLMKEGPAALRWIGEKFSELGTFVHNAIDAVLNWLRSNWPLLIGIFLGPLGIVIGLVITHWDQIKAAFNAATTWVTNLIRAWWSGEVRYWQSALAGLRDTVSRWKDDVLGVWNGLVSGIESFGSGIAGAIERGFKTGLNNAVGVINGFLGDVYGIPVIGGAISGALHGFKLPTFAQGGVTSGPSIVGEGAGPEYVIPTERQFGARARDLWVQAGHAIGALKMGAAGIGEIGGQCVAKGTLVATERGQIPIEDVHVGDRAWTRKGLRRVEDQALTRRNARVLRVRAGDREVVCTPGHRFWAAPMSEGDRSPVYFDGEHVSRHEGLLRRSQQERLHERLPRGEVSAERGGAYSGLLGNPVSGHVGAMVGDQGDGGGQQPLVCDAPVAPWLRLPGSVLPPPGGVDACTAGPAPVLVDEEMRRLVRVLSRAVGRQGTGPVMPAGEVGELSSTLDGAGVPAPVGDGFAGFRQPGPVALDEARIALSGRHRPTAPTGAGTVRAESADIPRSMTVSPTPRNHRAAPAGAGVELRTETGVGTLSGPGCCAEAALAAKPTSSRLNPPDIDLVVLMPGRAVSDLCEWNRDLFGDDTNLKGSRGTALAEPGQELVDDCNDLGRAGERPVPNGLLAELAGHLPAVDGATTHDRSEAVENVPIRAGHIHRARRSVVRGAGPTLSLEETGAPGDASGRVCSRDDCRQPTQRLSTSPAAVTKPRRESNEDGVSSATLADTPSVQGFLLCSGVGWVGFARTDSDNCREASNDVPVGYTEAKVVARDASLAFKQAGRPSQIGATIASHRESEPPGVRDRPVTAAPVPLMSQCNFTADWHEAQTLRVGDYVWLWDEVAVALTPASIDSIDEAPRCDTYNLTVRETHEYIANGILHSNCVSWVESVTGAWFPIGMASEMTKYINAPSPAPGLIFVSTLAPWGHTGIVTGLNEVIDSNWVQPLMVGMHALSDIPDIAGYINLGNPLGTLAAAASSAGKKVGSMLAGLIGVPLGAAENVARHLGGIGGAIALGSVDAIGDAFKTASFDSGGWLSPGLTLAWNGTGQRERVSPPNKGGDIHVHVTNPSPQPYEIARELAWTLKTAR